jgi:hypothetical protein
VALIQVFSSRSGTVCVCVCVCVCVRFFECLCL